MPSPRIYTFQERAALSREAKQKAIDRLRAKSAPADAEHAEHSATKQRGETQAAETTRTKATAKARPEEDEPNSDARQAVSKDRK